MKYKISVLVLLFILGLASNSWADSNWGTMIWGQDNWAVLDTDNDGLSDWDELNTYGTDPNNPDTDGDGLTDGVEVNILATDPTLTDSDNNGTPDGDEDHDGDGFTNAEEILCESDPGDPNLKCTRSLPFIMLLLD
jgi:hypothetical protein